MMLDPGRFELRRVKPGDAEALVRFYNNRSVESVRHFKPLGEQAAVANFVEIIAANSVDVAVQFDLVALHEADIIGWAFVWKLQTAQPKFGMVVGDQVQGRKVGEQLMANVMSHARDLDLKRIFLTVVTDNARAIGLYQQHGFHKQREFVSHEDEQRYYEMIWRSENRDR